MKRPALFRNVFTASLIIAGMNLTTSCDSCSRPDGNSQGTEDGARTNGDTRDTDSPADNQGSGSTGGTDQGAGGSSDNGSAARSSSSGSSSTGSSSSNGSSTSTGKNSSGMTEEEITDKIENSSSTPRKANGEPADSGGTSGSGTGTGTGSTGNNSRVSKAADQKN